MPRLSGELKPGRSPISITTSFAFEQLTDLVTQRDARLTRDHDRADLPIREAGNDGLQQRDRLLRRGERRKTIADHEDHFGRIVRRPLRERHATLFR